MTTKIKPAALNILVLCTGNSCRSILAEVLINSLGHDRFKAFSAGSDPSGTVNANAIELLIRKGFDTTGLASKNWRQFEGADAPEIDIVITVCDNAAGESCPLWNGSPVTVHWGIPDPAAATGEAIETAFQTAFRQLESRIKIMIELPLNEFDPRMQAEALRRIHDSVAAEEAAA